MGDTRHAVGRLPDTLLSVNNLKTQFHTQQGVVQAVRGVSFHLHDGEVLGLAGESGCGKTTAALSIMRLLPPTAQIVDGQILFKGKNMATMGEKELRTLRWKDISIIFQGSMNALNPVKNVSEQITESILLHEKVTYAEALERTKNLLQKVGLNLSKLRSYPHELSGGMRQRVMIAMSLACNPSLVIADEPVTALDVMVQAQILKLIKTLQNELNLSMILITHDLSVMADACNRLAIMYAGKIVEYGAVEAVFDDPIHPYTALLIKAFPSIEGPIGDLRSIPGSPPALLNPPSGCGFNPRCPRAREECTKSDPQLVEVGNGHFAACASCG
ncbi:MAG TPA: ABC transporter ATP-binding protein [Candidatus Dormibacteraeota bacterium]|nr:ABC transporter ATP-binding protein [Candidatus Dormibacteraeota bacterium]